jgi:hypothetical protein
MAKMKDHLEQIQNQDNQDMSN